VGDANQHSRLPIRRKRGVIGILAGAFVLPWVLLAIALLMRSPLWPGPGLPDGATRLNIVTEAAHLVPTMGCPAALLGPMRIAPSGDDLIVRSEADGSSVAVVWPSGWAAWRIGGRAELVAHDGSVVAREGDLIENRFGGGTYDDGAFHVCVIGG